MEVTSVVFEAAIKACREPRGKNKQKDGVDSYYLGWSAAESVPTNMRCAFPGIARIYSQG